MVCRDSDAPLTKLVTTSSKKFLVKRTLIFDQIILKTIAIFDQFLRFAGFRDPFCRPIRMIFPNTQSIVRLIELEEFLTLCLGTEVDFVISKQEVILPVEVKSDVSGKMKSLTVFMAERRKLPRALRISLLPYGSELVEASIAGMDTPAVFELLAVPLYLINRVYELA